MGFRAFGSITVGVVALTAMPHSATSEQQRECVSAAHVEFLLRQHERADEALAARITSLEAVGVKVWTAATRAELEQLADQHERRIDALENYNANMEGRLIVLGALWAVAMVGLNLLANFLMRRRKPNRVIEYRGEQDDN